LILPPRRGRKCMEGKRWIPIFMGMILDAGIIID